MTPEIKVLGVSGSPRRGATYRALEIALEAASTVAGTRSELVSLHNREIKPCIHCDRCKRKQELCFFDDGMVELYPKLMEADALILASPVYAMNVTPQMQAFLSRWRPINHVRRGVMFDKLAAGIAVGGARNGGQELVVTALANAAMARGLIFIGNEPFDYSGAMVWSKDGGAAGTDEDERAVESLRKLGRRVARLAHTIVAGREGLATDQAS